MNALHVIGYAIDAWLGELSRRGRSPETRRAYARTLNKFADSLPPMLLLHETNVDHYRRFLDRWRDASASTYDQAHTALNGFCEYHYLEGNLPANPMDRVGRRPRQRAEDLDVVTVTSADVTRLFTACQNWQEFLCIATIAYLGPRRRAASRLRLSDVDFQRGTIRFREKGAKTITKPIPDQLALILRLAEQEGVWATRRDYLIPNRRPARNAERSHKVIYDTVKKVAERAGIESHVHALRAAFAVQFDEAHPDQVVALKELLGHARLETTMVYLRRKDKAKAMEAVRDLSWGSVLPPSAVMPPAGFEPALAESGFSEPNAADAEPSLLDPLMAKLAELTNRGKQAAPRGEAVSHHKEKGSSVT